MEFRLCQPRDNEPVLHTDPVWHRGRAGSARDHVPVDGLGTIGRLGDGRRDEHRHLRQRQRHRRLYRRPVAFNKPIQKALDNGIPVIAYNANGKGPGTNPALAYVGQDLFLSGVEMGKRIVSLVDEGLVALFIATPGQLNIQPRIDGAKQSIEDSGANLEIQQVTTGAEITEERSRIEAWYNGHKDVAGMFAVDAGSTQGVAQTMEQFGLHDKGVKAGGYDLLPETLKLMKAGHIDFTIDQQPYLQGFFPVMQLYLYNILGGVTGPAETNTGLIFVTPETVDRYLQTESRFEGDSEVQKIVKAPS